MGGARRLGARTAHLVTSPLQPTLASMSKSKLRKDRTHRAESGKVSTHAYSARALTFPDSSTALSYWSFLNLLLRIEAALTHCTRRLETSNTARLAA